MMSTSLKVNICFVKCIENLYLASLKPFYLMDRRMNKKRFNDQRVHETSRNLYIYSRMVAFIHLWRHLFTSERLFSAYINFYHSTSNVALILWDFCPAIKHFFPKYTTDIFFSKLWWNLFLWNIIVFIFKHLIAGPIWLLLQNSPKSNSI